MCSLGRWITFGAALLPFLWIGSALGKPPGKPTGKETLPKNVIIMIGDGMGPEQVQSGRLLDPDGVLVMDEMDPNPGFATTYSIKIVNGEIVQEITDSAAAGTALATGVKTEYGNVSMAVDDVTVLPTSMEAAKAKGMATGILSSVYLCDATPGVWLAHAPSRSCSIIIPQQRDACPDVFLGSGKTEYVVFTKPINWIDEMVQSCNYEYVNTADELVAAQAPNDRLMGMWGGYTITYSIDRQNDAGLNDPTLAQMTAKAIEVLSRDRDGFFLMVEGGAIDWMAHNKDIAGTARDVVAFDDAVAVAYNFAKNDGETLLIVTADHETGGLQVGDSPNVEFIENTTASTDVMWGLVHQDGMSAEDVLETYAGVDDLTQAEKQAIADYGEMAISDALSARANVTWWLPTGIRSIAPEEGDHTYTEVPVYAYGPGSDSLEGHFDNTDIGKLLFWAVNGN
jgi:alkaline phosphatase